MVFLLFAGVCLPRGNEPPSSLTVGVKRDDVYNIVEASNTVVPVFMQGMTGIVTLQKRGVVKNLQYFIERKPMFFYV
jgi:hypothetical protein